MIRRAASRPSISGSWRSISTRAGRRCRTRSIDSAPDVAVITSKPPRARIVWTRSRLNGSLSTTSTVGSPATSPSPRRPLGLLEGRAGRGRLVEGDDHRGLGRAGGHDGSRSLLIVARGPAGGGPAGLRDREREPAPPALAALHPDPAAVQRDQLAGETQSQTRSLLPAVVGAVILEEGLADAGQLLGSDTDPVVRHGELQEAAVLRGLHDDQPPVGGELDRVGEQVQQDLAQ